MLWRAFWKPAPAEGTLCAINYQKNYQLVEYLKRNEITVGLCSNRDASNPRHMGITFTELSLDSHVACNQNGRGKLIKLSYASNSLFTMAISIDSILELSIKDCCTKLSLPMIF